MLCNGCGNLEAYRLRVADGFECCDSCGSLPSARHSDVYFREPYLDPNLVTRDGFKTMERKNGQEGVWVSSREHKARLMKERGVVEAGDKQHGARNLDVKLAKRWNPGQRI